MIRRWWARGHETEVEFRARMAQFSQDMEAAAQKSPEELKGDPLEIAYYGRKLQEALDADDQTAARELIGKMLDLNRKSSVLRLIAAMAYHQLGDEAEEMAQLGIALALDPQNYAVHRRMARLLQERGETEAANAALEQGWRYRQKHVAKRELAAERAQYFSVLDQT